MIPVRITLPLNIRKGAGTDYDKIGEIFPSGKVINMDGLKEDGTPWKSISKWYFKINDKNEKQWYWGGRVEEVKEVGKAMPFLKMAEPAKVAKVDYNKLANVPEEWKTLGGADVNIAILDSGCFNHKTLQGSIKAKYNAIDDNQEINDTLSGHGTFISGILAAKNDNEVGGIAKNVNLIVIKVSVEDSGINEEHVYKGLEWLANKCPLKPDIINISLQFSPNQFLEKFNDLFKSFSDSGTLIYSGAQNDDSLAKNIFYPASNEYVNAVGALASHSPLVKEISAIQDKVRYLVANIDYYSFNNSFFNLYTHKNGCSFATAMLSGITALALSYYKKNNTALPFKEFFNQAIDSFNPDSFSDNYKMYKLL